MSYECECATCKRRFHSDNKRAIRCPDCSTLKPEGEQISSNRVRGDGGCLYCEADQGENHRSNCTKPDVPINEQISGEAVEGGWRDISTAPRDGAPVFLYDGEHRYISQWPLWESIRVKPTHWQPLPNPPECKT